MATPQEVIKAFTTYLDRTNTSGRAALDKAVRKIANYASWQNLIDYAVSDCAAYGGDGERFLREKCGIILNNSDTGAITGADAGSGITKTAESIVPEDGPFVYPESSTSVFDGLTVIWPDRNSLTYSQQLIVAALNSWWIASSLLLLYESYGLRFNDSPSTLTVNFVYGDTSFLASCGYSGNRNDLALNINMRYWDNIYDYDPNGKSPHTYGYLDKTISHELTHAIFFAKMNGYSNSTPKHFTEGIADLTSGIDHVRTSDIRRISSDASRLSSLLNGHDNSSIDNYSAGYILLRYLAYQTSIGAGNPTIHPPIPSGASVNGNTILLGSEFNGSLWLDGIDLFTNQWAYGNESVVIVDASQTRNNILLTGNEQNNFIAAGFGSSSIWGGDGGNDTLQGGSGRDMFWFGSGCGADEIFNFTTGSGAASDILNFYSGDITQISRSQNKLAIKMKGSDSLSINTGNGSSNDVIQFSTDAQNIYRAKISDSRQYNSNPLFYDSTTNFFIGGETSNSRSIYITGSNNSNVWLDGSTGQSYSNIKNIDASSSDGENQLVGDKNNNLIIGGSGSQSLWGGIGGSDTLCGGSGKDMFWYGRDDGYDVIQNSDPDDIVMLYTPMEFSYMYVYEDTLHIGIKGHSYLTIEDWSEDNSVNTFQSRNGSKWGLHVNEGGNVERYQK